jgi:hypothetical protein
MTQGHASEPSRTACWWTTGRSKLERFVDVWLSSHARQRKTSASRVTDLVLFDGGGRVEADRGGDPGAPTTDYGPIALGL